MAPFGYFQLLSDFVLIDDTEMCLAIGALPKSEFFLKLKSKLQEGTLKDELKSAFNNRAKWPRDLFNVSKINASRDDVVVLR
ncbi:hypothetical protein [Lactiplantibacillus plantarum]|uniref:hypothetical protein n=1 Tax=Lactiplantibacillus plantarum TaxID=1590 RepID=UPI000930E276